MSIVFAHSLEIILNTIKGTSLPSRQTGATLARAVERLQKFDAPIPKLYIYYKNTIQRIYLNFKDLENTKTNICYLRRLETNSWL